MHKVLALTALFHALPKPDKGIGLAVQLWTFRIVDKQSGCTALRWGAAPHLQCMPYRVCDGIEAAEMALQQHKAGYYYPDPKQDMWSFGLLLFTFFKRMGQLPHEHQIAIRDGTTLLFASTLCGQARYTEWQHKVTSEATPDSMNDLVG